jgi:diguanylate cyclase (GGDEF)-like protein
VKVTGISTYQIPGHALYLQDDSDGILIQTTSTELIEPGRKVEAVGFPATGAYAPILKDSLFRVVGNAAPITPVRIEAKDVIVLQTGFYNVPFDGQLVQLQGRILETHIQNGQRVWILEHGKHVFEAYLPLSNSTHGVEDIGSGGVLLLTGICTVHADLDRDPISFGILLRSPQDIVVLKRAPWWNASHAWWVVAFLTMVIFAMAGWMVVVRRQAALRLLSVTDPLTGLYNRRGFLLLAKHQWLLALRRKKPFLLFYIDVDHFKEINDLLGHKVGDQALQDFVTMLRECFRTTDIIGRIGGDEFAITTDDASPEARAMIEQRLAGIVEQKNNSAGRAYKLVLSVGVLTCDSSMQGLSIEDLLAKADTLMYQQKQEHRSRKA